MYGLGNHTGLSDILIIIFYPSNQMVHTWNVIPNKSPGSLFTSGSPHGSTPSMYIMKDCRVGRLSSTMIFLCNYKLSFIISDIGKWYTYISTPVFQNFFSRLSEN